MIKSVKIKILGDVQGVFYRVKTVEMAKKIGGLKGYVKNEPDRSVLIKVLGEEDKVNQLIKWCQKGPKHAIVKNVIVEKTAPVDYESFMIEPN